MKSIEFIWIVWNCLESLISSRLLWLERNVTKKSWEFHPQPQPIPSIPSTCSPHFCLAGWWMWYLDAHLQASPGQYSAAAALRGRRTRDSTASEWSGARPRRHRSPRAWTRCAFPQAMIAKTIHNINIPQHTSTYLNIPQHTSSTSTLTQPQPPSQWSTSHDPSRTVAPGHSAAPWTRPGWSDPHPPPPPWRRRWRIGWTWSPGCWCSRCRAPS